MIEVMLIKPLGYLLLVVLPAKLLLAFVPPSWRRVLEYEIWADPDQ